MKEEIINGFKPEEIFKLYSFISIYESVGIKSMNETDLINRHPNISTVFEVLDRFKYEEKKKDELAGIDENSLNNEFYFTEHNSLKLGVLYHLRNSIAHAKIFKDCEYVIITDFDNKKDNPAYTAKGRVLFSIIDEMQSKLKEIIENKIEQK